VAGVLGPRVGRDERERAEEGERRDGS